MSFRFAVVVAAFAGLVVVAACSDDEPLARAPIKSPTPATTAAAPIASESPTPEAGDCAGSDPTNALLRVSGPLIGDVDGDGAPDRTYLSLDAAAPQGCQAFVVVSGTVTVAGPIADWDPAAGLPAPALNRLAQIDGRSGAEIVVNLAAGASTQFVGVYSAFGGSLERITAEERGGASPSGAGDLFAFGGSVGHLEAVDCTTGGEVVITSAIPKGNRYQVERRFYETVDATLELNLAKTERPVVSAAGLDDFPEFASSPFGSCPTA